MNYWRVYLSLVGDRKVNMIKAVRDISGLGLKESKDLVEGVANLHHTNMVIEGLTQGTAEKVVQYLMAASPNSHAYYLESTFSLSAHPCEHLLWRWLTDQQPVEVIAPRQPKPNLMARIRALELLRTDGTINSLTFTLSDQDTYEVKAKLAEELIQAYREALADLTEPEVPF